MAFDSEVTVEGVTERLFELNVAGERVTCVLWAPEGATDPRPLICMGHGGTQNKKTPGIVARANNLARRHGYATLAIDGPGHGERVSNEERERFARETQARIAAQSAGGPRAPLVDRSAQHTPEWKAALDHVQALDYIGAGKVGYWGVSMGTHLGVPFVAAEPRITFAIFGLLGLREGAFAEAARSITIPLQFIFQWDDELMTREAGVALFDAFASKEKTMHINPGRHVGIPQFEAADWEAFYVRHLGRAADAPAL